MISLQTLAIWAPIIVFVVIGLLGMIERQAINREQQREQQSQKAGWGSN